MKLAQNVTYYHCSYMKKKNNMLGHQGTKTGDSNFKYLTIQFLQIGNFTIINAVRIWLYQREFNNDSHLNVVQNNAGT